MTTIFGGKNGVFFKKENNVAINILPDLDLLRVNNANLFRRKYFKNLNVGPSYADVVARVKISFNLVFEHEYCSRGRVFSASKTAKARTFLKTTPISANHLNGLAFTVYEVHFGNSSVM
jgi:hypothetical protein